MQEPEVVAFEVLVPAVSQIIAAFLRRCRCSIAVDDADVELTLPMQQRHRLGKNRIKAPLSFKPPKSAVNSGVMDLGSPIFVVFDGQFFPRTAEVQQFQNVVEYCVQRELWLRSTTAKVQVGQDNFFKLF